MEKSVSEELRDFLRILRKSKIEEIDKNSLERVKSILNDLSEEDNKSTIVQRIYSLMPREVLEEEIIEEEIPEVIEEEVKEEDIPEVIEEESEYTYEYQDEVLLEDSAESVELYDSETY